MVTADRAKTAMCGEMEALTQSYVDGELAGRDHETYERHLGECERCRSAVHFARRMKAAVRGHLARRQVSSAFEHRLRVALASQPEAPPRWPWLTWSRAVPALALVGAVVVVVATAQNHHSVVMDQARRTYQAELPLDVTGSDCSSVSSWFRGRVDFPVHPPKLPAQIRCQGGRLVNVEDRPAAYLVYQDQKGHRLSVLVFDAESAPIEAPIRRIVDGREVFYRGGPGISTVGFHDRGLGYVMTADLDMDSMDGLLQASLH
jgi:anti-sigma factor RsiW